MNANGRGDKTAYETVARVCAAFALTEPVAVERVVAGYLNRDEAVTLADGRRLFLKGSRHHDAAVVRAEHAVIAYAAAHGIPTPLPLTAPDGDTVIVIDDVPWSVFPFHDGTTLSGPTMAARQGTMLARIHHALMDCPTAGLTFAEGPLTWDTGLTLAEMDGLEARILARADTGRADDFDRWTRQAFARLRHILRKAPLPEAFGRLPVGVIHGDFYPPNLLSDTNGEIVAVLDWEFSTVRPRVWDAMRALAFTYLGVHGEGPNHAGARQCMEAYRAAFPLSPEEFAAGVQLYLWRTAHNLVKYRWHDERGPGPTDALAPGDLALIEWLHTHGADFAARLTA